MILNLTKIGIKAAYCISTSLKNCYDEPRDIRLQGADYVQNAIVAFDPSAFRPDPPFELGFGLFFLGMAVASKVGGRSGIAATGR